MVYHRVSIQIAKNSLTISIYGIAYMAFTLYNDALKSRLFRKFLNIEDIFIDDTTSYFSDMGMELQENMLDLMKLLAPINLTENNKLKKAAEEYLGGSIELETFEQEVVACLVAEKLSE